MRPPVRRTLRYRLPLIGLLLWAASGCAMAQVTFQRDAAVQTAFETGKVLPGYDYYYSGPEALPMAVVGIRHGLPFAPGFWKPIALTEKNLLDWRWVINNDTRPLRSRYHGARILDPAGRQIGIWYSFLDWITAETTPDGEVILYTPDNTKPNLFRLFNRNQP